MIRFPRKCEGTVYVPKRKRTKSRIDDMFHLAASAHTNNWSAERTDQEFEEWLAKNDDLLDERSRKTARDEFRDMANHRLKGSLPKIRALTNK